MPYFNRGSIGVFLTFLIAGCSINSTASQQPLAQVSPTTALPHYQVFELPHSRIYTLRIPAQNSVELAVSPTLATPPQFAKESQAIAVLNAGYFDPQNQKTTAYLTVQGKSVGDPKSNPHLMNNPKLQSYLPQILNRSEFRRYLCDQKTQYAIAFHQDPIPSHCQLIDAVGGGPRLLPELTATQEAFWQEDQDKVVRDAIGLKQRNARTAIGIFATGDLLWVIAAQKPESPQNSGLSLAELAEFLQSQGVKDALNLDGGSSSALYYQGQTESGKFNEQGQPILRPVKSVLFIRK